MYQPLRLSVSLCSCDRSRMTRRFVLFSPVQGVEDIQLDMMKYGSVTAAFSVHSDFLTYSGGVYSNKSGWLVFVFNLIVAAHMLHLFDPISQT